MSDEALIAEWPACPYCTLPATDTEEDIVSNVPIECIECHALVVFDVTVRRFYCGAIVRSPEDHRI
jgi:hypothetical protein